MFKLIAVIVAMISFVPQIAQAQVWPSLDRAPAAEKTGEKDVAILIAVENYAFLPNVPGARKNLAAWQTFLRDGLGVKSVYRLVDAQATKENILEMAKRASKEAKKGATVWLLFIGHGAPNPKATDGLLIGADGQQNPSSMVARGVPQSKLIKTLEKGKQARTVIIFDACFSGRDGGGEALAKGAMPVLPVKAPKVKGQTVVLTAARSDEFAGDLPGEDRPAFSYLLLGAMHGWADGGDGVVTAQEAIRYVDDQLIRIPGRNQTPQLAGRKNAKLTRGVSARRPEERREPEPPEEPDLDRPEPEVLPESQPVAESEDERPPPGDSETAGASAEAMEHIETLIHAINEAETEDEQRDAIALLNHQPEATRSYVQALVHAMEEGTEEERMAATERMDALAIAMQRIKGLSASAVAEEPVEPPVDEEPAPTEPSGYDDSTPRALASAIDSVSSTAKSNGVPKSPLFGSIDIGLPIGDQVQTLVPSFTAILGVKLNHYYDSRIGVRPFAIGHLYWEKNPNVPESGDELRPYFDFDPSHTFSSSDKVTDKMTGVLALGAGLGTATRWGSGDQASILSASFGAGIALALDERCTGYVWYENEFSSSDPEAECASGSPEDGKTEEDYFNKDKQDYLFGRVQLQFASILVALQVGKVGGGYAGALLVGLGVDP